jgi:hypothetical protein
LAIGVTRFTAGAIVTCGVLAGIEVASAAGAQVPHAVAVIGASVVAVIAATVAVRNVVFVWRGPVILAFRRGDAMLCDAREASTVRSAAQLRGTMGGAGYLHPRRLVLSAAAWAAVSVQSLALLGPQRTPATFIPLGVAIGAAALSAVFPASPFFYREAAGGCVVAFPPQVCRRLLETAGVAPALAPIALGMCPVDGAAAPKAAAGADGAAAEDAPRPDPGAPA